jgi:excisionase family DNA binding protein
MTMSTASSSPVVQRPFLNLDEAAALVGLKPPTLRRAIRNGQLAYARPGRAYLVRPSDVTTWLEAELRCGGVKVATKRATR